MSAAGAAPSAIISTGLLDEVMELLHSSPLTSISIDLENDLRLTISSDTSTQNVGIEQPADFNVEVTPSSATSAQNLVVHTTFSALQRALSILSFLRQLTPSVVPSATMTSSVPHMSGSGSNPSASNSMTSSVVPHMSGPESNPSRKRRKSVDASLASAIVKELRAEEIVAILIKAYENHRDVRDAVNASPASAIVKELRAEESAAILIKAYEKHCDVRDAVNAAFYKRRVYVHNIPLTAKPVDLKKLLMPFGEIVDTKIITTLKVAVNVEVSVGRVVFEKPEYAEKAVNFGQQDFLGSKIELHAGSVDCSLCGRFI